MSIATVAIPNPLHHGDYDRVGAQGVMAPMGPTFLTVKLGRLAPKARPATARMHALFDHAKVTNLPTETNRREKAWDSIRRMYKNDQYGCCVISAKYHAIGLWTGNDSPTGCKVVDDSIIVQMYNRLKAGAGDSGCVVSDVLDYWRDQGLPVGTSGLLSRLDGYVAVDWRNKQEVMVAIFLFGRLTLAIDLPGEWASNPTTWDGPQTGIVGGHDIDCVDYNAQGVVISTWGGTRLITWSAFTSLNSNTELYAMVGADWYNDDRLSPTGLTVETLKARLKILGGNDLPPIDPDTPPVPPGPTPVPPVPPTPPVPPMPPSPAEFPIYHVSLTGPLGMSFDGVAIPAKSAYAAEFNPNWAALIEDVMGLVTAVMNKEYAAIPVLIQKLLADLHLFGAKGTASGLSPEQWQAIITAVLTLLQAFLKPKV